jgi:sigma-54 dependent transcriptional regulator, acetoin dehydrogenase operon transcriptional activator AcoR
VQHLLDRVSVVTLEVPPLRDRPEDIPLLIQQLNERHSGLTPLRFSPAAMRALCRAPWPGNIRQLENVIRGIAATGRVREVTPNLLPDLLGTYATSRTLTMMEQLEMNAILETVTATRGNKVEMAKMLGISRSTLYRKMRYFRIDVDRAA